MSVERENQNNQELAEEAPEEKAVRITVSEERRCVGLAEVAKLVGCHKFHLSAVLHGRRKASDKLRRNLLALGIAETADGERI